jgi:serine protease Do
MQKNISEIFRNSIFCSTFELLNISYLKINNMLQQKILIGLACSFLGLTCAAQNNADASVSSKGQKQQQVIIKKEGNKNSKLTIEFNGDVVTINNKPILEFKEDGITINSAKIEIGDANKIEMDLMDLEKDFANIEKSISPDDIEDISVFKETTKDGKVIIKTKDKPYTFLGVVTETHKSGVIIENVEDSSPAKKAGLMVDDVITKIDDVVIETPADLSKVIRAKKENDKIEISILRNDKAKKISATLGSKKLDINERRFVMRMPNGQSRMFKMPNITFPGRPNIESFSFGNQNQPKLGLKVQDTPEENGVKILDVEKESLAEKAGLKVNDIITEFNDREVKNTDQFRMQTYSWRGWDAAKKGGHTMKVLRDGKTIDIKLVIPRELKIAEL